MGIEIIHHQIDLLGIGVFFGDLLDLLGEVLGFAIVRYFYGINAPLGFDTTKGITGAITFVLTAHKLSGIFNFLRPEIALYGRVVSLIFEECLRPFLPIVPCCDVRGV